MADRAPWTEWRSAAVTTRAGELHVGLAREIAFLGVQGLEVLDLVPLTAREIVYLPSEVRAVESLCAWTMHKRMCDERDRLRAVELRAAIVELVRAEPGMSRMAVVASLRHRFKATDAEIEDALRSEVVEQLGGVFAPGDEPIAPEPPDLVDDADGDGLPPDVSLDDVIGEMVAGGMTREDAARAAEQMGYT